MTFGQWWDQENEVAFPSVSSFVINENFGEENVMRDAFRDCWSAARELPADPASLNCDHGCTTVDFCDLPCGNSARPHEYTDLAIILERIRQDNINGLIREGGFHEGSTNDAIVKAAVRALRAVSSAALRPRVKR